MFNWVKNKCYNYLTNTTTRQNTINRQKTFEQKKYDFACFLILCKTINIIPDICYTHINSSNITKVNIFIPSNECDETIGDTFDEIKLMYNHFNFNFDNILEVVIFESITIEKFLAYLLYKSKSLPTLWESINNNSDDNNVGDIMTCIFEDNEYLVPIKFKKNIQDQLIVDGIIDLITKIKEHPNYLVKIHQDKDVVEVNFELVEMLSDNLVDLSNNGPNYLDQQKYIFTFSLTLDASIFVNYYLNRDVETWYELKFWPEFYVKN